MRRFSVGILKTFRKVKVGKVDTLKMVPLALPSGCPLSNDPLFKVSEGRPPRSNRSRNRGITVDKCF